MRGMNGLVSWLRLKRLLRSIRTRVRAIPYHGNARHCPVCETSSRAFRPFGNPPRPQAHCAHCYSLERHRLVWLYFTRRTALFDGRPKIMLHLAPEYGMERRLRHRIGSGYITADLMNPEVMVRMDVTAIEYPDESFDVIYCSHVLEHVPDDRGAMRELHRVLKRDGWAVLQVPTRPGATYEDPAIVDPLERLRAFGQEDHVRQYGDDFADRLRQAGFAVQVVTPEDVVGRDDWERLGIGPAAGDLYVCTKSSTP
jgi:SAM-dependent methyltransferase